MPDTLFQDTVCVIFDVETTGLFAFGGDKICEISALKVKGRSILGRYYSLVNPERAIGPEAFAVHGITQEQVAYAPTLEQILPDFLKFIDEAVLIAYNSDFDVGFINVALLKQSCHQMDNKVIDLLVLARRLLPGLSRYNLDTVAEAIGLTHDKRHRAEVDCELTYKVFLHFLDLLKENKISTLEQVLEFSQRRRFYA